MKPHLNVPDKTSQAFFDEKYQRDADPWNFAASDYEQSRYDAMLAALQHRRYARAFEPGCSIGALTERLASICDHVDAIDISPTAVKLAQERCQAMPGVHLAVGSLPNAMPDGLFDLLIFSEIGYYFQEPQLAWLRDQLLARLQPGGVLLAAHWLGQSEDHLLSGDRVHQILREAETQSKLQHEYAERHEFFRLDRWSRI